MNNISECNPNAQGDAENVFDSLGLSNSLSTKLGLKTPSLFATGKEWSIRIDRPVAFCWSPMSSNQTIRQGWPTWKAWNKLDPSHLCNLSCTKFFSARLIPSLWYEAMARTAESSSSKTQKSKHAVEKCTFLSTKQGKILKQTDSNVDQDAWLLHQTFPSQSGRMDGEAESFTCDRCENERSSCEDRRSSIQRHSGPLGTWGFRNGFWMRKKAVKERQG